MAEAPLELGKEYPPQGEEAQIEKILTMSKLSMQHKPHPPMQRDQHPKSHGCVQGEFIVEEDIPETMKVGVFKECKTYPDLDSFFQWRKRSRAGDWRFCAGYSR